MRILKCLFFLWKIQRIYKHFELSQLNVNCYIRGQPNDYDRWAEKAGDDKFKYENVLPIFKQQQQAVGYGTDEFNGRDGFLKTSRNNLDALSYGDLCKAFMEAGIQAQFLIDFKYS